ncbi:MAG: hypothetical protein K8L99_28110 [Anaerolineae bacterium]|nr:hypothetical protein [Anaerolineae bacterium]
MPLTEEEKKQLIEAYEPILYFHPEEKFVPVRPEAYLQSAALWHSQPPSHNKTDWGNGGPGFPRTPIIPKGGISVNPADDLEGSGDPDGDGVNEWYLGHEEDGTFPYLISNDERELWLDLAAWADTDAVDDASLNQECNIERAQAMMGEEPLNSGKDWYYAEVQELNGIEDLLASLRKDGVDLGQLIREQFGEAWFIWYYFLYPIHEENFRRCEEVVGAGNHGNYEGDWSAVGIIVRKPLTLPWEPGGTFPSPEWIGYSVRLRGVIENFLPTIRQGMLVRPWSDVRKLGRHAKIYVAEGSHNNYSIPGDKNPPAVALGGIPIGDATCETTEEVDSAVRDKLAELEDTLDTVRDVVVTLAKVGVGFAIGGPLGAIVGGIAGLIEAASSGGGGSSEPVDDAVETEMERDHAATEGSYGLVLKPADPAFSIDDAADATEVRPWAGDIQNRIVNRETQVWWPPTSGNDPGYKGRWGVMVQEDTFDRRSGQEFPDFRRAFLLDLALHFSGSDS